MRRAWLILAALLSAAPVRAQQSAPAVVDYITQRTIYLLLTGGGERWMAGDTVQLAPWSGEYVGRMRVIAATETRIAGEWLRGGIPFTAGDSVRIETLRDADTAKVSADTAVVRVTVAPPSATVPVRSVVPRVVHGSGGLDVLSMHSARTGGPTHTTVTSAARLNAHTTHLPGGLEGTVNVRGSFYDAADPTGTQAELHVYALELARDFNYAQLRLGRFVNSYDPYGSFLDGVSVRAGSRNGPGAGIVLGADPRDGSGGWTTGNARMTAFVEANVRRGALGARGEASVHSMADTGGTRRTYVGVRQHLMLGSASLTQLARVDRLSDQWTLTILDLAASTQLGQAWHIGARYGTERSDLVWAMHLPPQRTHRTSANLMWLHGASAVGADVTAAWAPLDSAGADTPSLAITAWSDIALRGAGLELSAHVWTRDGVTSLQLAPAVRGEIAGARVRGGYRLYRAGTPVGSDILHSGDISATIPFSRFDVDVRLSHDQGRGLAVTRLLTGLWLRL